MPKDSLDACPPGCQHSLDGPLTCPRWRYGWDRAPAGSPALPPQQGYDSRSRTVLLARRYRQSPVFYDPTPSRWPWVLALLLVFGIIAAAAVIRPGVLPL